MMAYLAANAFIDMFFRPESAIKLATNAKHGMITMLHALLASITLLFKEMTV